MITLTPVTLSFMSSWADILIAGCNLGFTIALIPTIWAGRHQQHVPYLTSVPYTILLAINSLALLSQGLVLGCAASTLGTCLWAMVVGERAWQSVRSAAHPSSDN